MSSAIWADASMAARLFALAPALLGGVALRCGAGPVRERWLEATRAMFDPAMPVCRMPLHIADDRLLGGIDLPATLRSGRPVAQRGLLAQADGGVLLLPMAERVSAATAARIAAAMDNGEVVLAREGVALRSPARFGVIALDEGIDADEQLSAVLADRLAFHVDLSELRWRETASDARAMPSRIDAARARLPSTTAGDDVIQALAAAAASLGIGSPRTIWLALCAARAAAAWRGHDQVGQADTELAARLVLAPRALAVPATAQAEQPEAALSAEDQAAAPNADDDKADDNTADDNSADETDDDPAPDPGVIEDQVIAAAQAAIGAGLLARLQSAERAAGAARSHGRSGALQNSKLRGRPAGVSRGEAGRGARLNLIETLRASAPWQKLRRRQPGASGRVVVLPEDFRVTRYQERRRTTTVFCIDASGSSALHRLAEAKGAVELLLADCYVRRDQVAVLAFRGAGAELLLPATRSLVRAKRSLAGLPGGGGTPLAAGLDAALTLAEAIRRRGDSPLVVLLTDGRANIARDGSPDRVRAELDALQAAGRWRAAGLMSLVVDTSARPEPRAKALAERMQARYLPLPYAQAATLSQAVRAAIA